MKVRRETMLIVGLILILVLITGAAALFQARQSQNPPLSSHSNAPDGALALRLWFSEAGYQVNNPPSDRFAVPPGTKAVIILEPSPEFKISTGEWKILDNWVRQGGTLLLAAQDWDTAFSGNPFKVTWTKVEPKEVEVFPPAPIFRTPPLVQPAHLLIQQTLNYADSDSLPILSIPAGTVAWQIHLGKGQLLALADAAFLSNAGLKTEGNLELALNLFSQVPPGSGVYFDEWHHGERLEDLTGYGPMAWLTQTPAGFAVLFAAGVIFLGLILSGRPFGQRVPLSRAGVRRGSIEYVNALANLNRRAGHRQAVMSYYYAELKRGFGKRYRLDPDLSDSEFINLVKQVNPALDSTDLGKLLGSLHQKRFTENEMVELARQCANWMTIIEH